METFIQWMHTCITDFLERQRRRHNPRLKDAEHTHTSPHHLHVDILALYEIMNHKREKLCTIIVVRDGQGNTSKDPPPPLKLR